MAYSTSTHVAAILQTEISGSTDPSTDEVTDFISRADALINRKTGRIWSTATTSEYHDIRGVDVEYSRPLRRRSPSPVIHLRNYPVVSMTFLRENTAGLGSGASWASRTEGVGGDYLVDLPTGRIRWHLNIPLTGRHNIFVGYTYGVSSTPAEIQDLSATLAALDVWRASRATANSQGYDSVTIGNVSYSFGDAAKTIETLQKKSEDIFKAIGRWGDTYPI
jgi:hypothetical protein